MYFVGSGHCLDECYEAIAILSGAPQSGASQSGHAQSGALVMCLTLRLLAAPAGREEPLSFGWGGGSWPVVWWLSVD